MSKTCKPLPPAEELWELFSYNPLTRNLHWRQGKKRAKKGAKAGSLNLDRGYTNLCLNGEQYAARRLVWRWIYGEDPGQQTLVYAKPQAHNTSGYKGVSRKRSRWRADISFCGKKKYLGSYSTPEEAHRAYCEASNRLHGTFARLG